MRVSTIFSISLLSAIASAGVMDPLSKRTECTQQDIDNCSSCETNCGNTCGINDGPSGVDASCAGCYDGCQASACSHCAGWYDKSCQSCGGVYADSGVMGLGYCNGGTGSSCTFCISSSDGELSCDMGGCGASDGKCQAPGPYQGCACS